MKAMERLMEITKLDSTYMYNNEFKVLYISQGTFNNISDILSEARRKREITGEQYHLIIDSYKELYKKGVLLRHKIRQLPRSKAQLFIRKKSVRNFIFSRDRVCLRCGTDKYLTIDHIIPVSKGGENELSNLQTLCRSCNSYKHDAEIDYRK